VGYTINSDILNEAKCRDDFSCLSGDDTCLCEVEKYIEGDSGVLFIKPRDEYCHNEMSYGHKSFCNCPARKEIYINYKI
jgi:hypothetical protein